MISAFKTQNAVRKAEKIYKKIADEDRDLAEDLLTICAEPTATYNVRKSMYVMKK